MTAPKMVETDARRRVSLSKVGNPEHRYYAATVDPSGVITLTPVVFVPVTALPQPQEDPDGQT